MNEIIEELQKIIAEEEMMDILNKEIFRELMLQDYPDITNEEVDKYFDMSGKNPWDGKMLYEVTRLYGKLNDESKD